MKRLWLILLTLLLIVNGCGSKSDSKSTSSQISSYKEQNEQSLNKEWKDWEGIGAISIGFETRLFSPERMYELWWVYFESDSLASIYFDAAGKPKVDSDNPILVFYKTLKFRIKGIISPKGRYGHLNVYEREILIQGISEINK
jgi:hypothetical protein